MSKKNKLFDGKSKTGIETPEDDKIILEFKDDALTKKGKAKGRGAANNQLSAFIFKYLDGYHVPNHLIEQKSDTSMLVKKADMIGFTVTMHNVATGDLCKRLGFDEGEDLTTPVMEYYLKNESLGSPMINDYHVYAKKLATQQELQTLSKLALKINAVLKSFFQRRNILLAGFQLEFGHFEDEIILADELSADSCTLWDVSNKEKPDKNALNPATGKPEEKYKEILGRVLK